MCRITFPGLKIMYIILTTPVALILLVYGIYKCIMRQSDREKEFWIDQKVYGQVPTWRDFSNKKFLWAVCGAGFFIIVQFGSLGLIWLIRHVGKFNTGKVILFFLLIGVITAILLAKIGFAAF